MEKQSSDEPQQLQFSGTETLFPTNASPGLFRTDVTAIEIPFLVDSDETVPVETAIDRALATEEFVLSSVAKNRLQIQE